MIYSACCYPFKSDSSLATDTGLGMGWKWPCLCRYTMHKRQPVRAYQALCGHTATQECVLIGCQTGCHFCVSHANSYMAGSASHTSPTPEWAGEQEKLGTCHRVSGKRNEDTVRKQSEITPNCLLCGEQRGGGVVPQAPVPASLSSVG